MNDPISKPTAGQPDALRRKIAKAGLAAPVVLATLASKPVLGAAPYNCTISGQMSGNTSSHGTPGTCAIGYSPGYWKNHTNPGDWPTILPNAAFNTVFADAYWWTPQNMNAVNLCMPQDQSCQPNPTFLQVLSSTGGSTPNNPALARAAVASYLNAYKFAPNYALTPAEVVAMFNSVYSGGTYPINPTTSWNADQVKTYFESLYQ